MKNAMTVSAWAILALAHSAPLAAQSINPALDRQQSESRLSAAVTIPLGASPDTKRTAPRFEIIASTRAPEGARPVIARDNDLRWQERRLGWTLDGSNQLMLNGQPLTKNDRRDGISTPGAVGIGLGVVLVLSLAFAQGVDDTIDRLRDPN